MALNGYTPVQITATEEPHLRAGVPLMQRAAAALARECTEVLDGLRPGGVRGAEVVLLVGSGNNGGDALYAGARLARAGARVGAVLTGSGVHQEGLAALREAGGEDHRLVAADTAGSASQGSESSGSDSLSSATDNVARDRTADLAAWAARADLVVDGMLGTGGAGGLRDAPAALVRALLERMDAAEGPAVIACDLPSGLDATTGQITDPVLPAGRTVTFIGAKTGLLCTPRPSVRGRITVHGLGIAADLPGPSVVMAEDADFPRLWEAPREGDQKYSRGVLGTVAGSDEYPGAGLMCVRAAVNAGTGMVRFLGGDVLAGAMALSVPEAVRTESVQAHRVQAWAVGPGATGSSERSSLAEALDSGLPVVADAAAVELVAQRAADGRRADPRVLITPHAGELARALEWVARLDPRAARGLREAAGEAGLGEEDLPETAPDRAQIEAAPLVWARAAHAVLGATVLLKGTVTVVAGPQTVRAHTGNSPWLATAGSGDTLTGLLGAAFAARRARAEDQEEEMPGGAWAETAAGALLVQRGISRRRPGPVPPTVAAARIPETIGDLLGG